MRLAVPVLAVVAAAALGGCGGTDSRAADEASSSPTVQEQTTDAAVAAFDDYIQAVSAGDSSACDLETTDYADRANAQFADSTQETGTDCPTRIAEIEALSKQFGIDLGHGAYHPRDGATDTEVTLDIDWPDGTASVYVMDYQDGAWLVADDDTLNGDLLEPSGSASP